MRVSSTDVGLTQFDGVESSQTQSLQYVGAFGRTTSLSESGVGALRACTSCSTAQPEYTGVPGYTPRWAVKSAISRDTIIDQPYKRDTSGLFFAKQIGHVMGIPSLAQAKASDPQNVVLVRATNVAALTAAWLLKFKPEVRQKSLETLTNIAWTQRVLKLAGSIPGGGVGISDAVRFSLGLHFLKGILEKEKGEDTEDAKFYSVFAELFKEAEQALAGGTVKLDGLDMPGAQLDGLGRVNGLGGLLDDIKNAAKKAAAAVVSAAKTIKKGIDKVADGVKDIICTGLKKLPVIGPTVGAAICWILEKGIDTIKNTLKMVIAMIETSITALITFFKILLTGKVKVKEDGVEKEKSLNATDRLIYAVKALLIGVTQMIFLLAMPFATTFLGVSEAELRDIGTRVAERNPFFPLTLLFAIIGLIPKPSTSGLSTLVLALAPAIAVMLGPVLMKIIKFTREKAEEGIEKFIKVALVIFQGYMALKDVLPRLRTQLEAFFNKPGSITGSLKGGANAALDAFKQTWEKIKNGFSSGKFQDASKAISSLLSTVGSALFGAILEDTNKELPAFSETIKAVKDAKSSVDEQEKMLKQANAMVLKNMGLEERRAVVMDNATQLKPQQSGVLAAKLIREQYLAQKDPTKKNEFKQALEAELQK